MCSQKEEFEKNLIWYYNHKFKSKSHCEYDSIGNKFIWDEDIVAAGKKIKVSLFAIYLPPDVHSAYSVHDKISMTIIVDDHGIKFPLCGVKFDLGNDLKNIIKVESYGFDSRKEMFDELINIFKAWDSSMDEFINKLKVLNISLL